MVDMLTFLAFAILSGYGAKPFTRAVTCGSVNDGRESEGVGCQG